MSMTIEETIAQYEQFTNFCEHYGWTTSQEEIEQVAALLRELAERRKAQLSQEGTTSDTISKTETVEHLRRVLEATVPNTDYDEGFIDYVNTLI